MPVILDNIFTGIANTTSTPTGWEGGWVGNHEMVGKGYIFTKTVKWHRFVPFSHLHITHKAAKYMVKLIISQLCGELQLAICICLSRGYGAICRRPEHLWMSEKLQKQAQQKEPVQLSASIPG